METLEILHTVLIIFTCVIWVLLSIVLVKTIKILNALWEIVDVYNKMKAIAAYYEALPKAFSEILIKKINSLLK